MIPSTSTQRLLTVSILTAMGLNTSVATNPVSGSALAASGAMGAPAVTTCSDSGVGSLRDAMLHANDGDVISLYPLTCGRITLSTPLTATAANLTINGNGVVLDGNTMSRVLVHGGTGLMTLNDMTIRNGFYTGPLGGGCIYSAGSVALTYSTITDCTLYTSGQALGGGIDATRAVVVASSTVTNNRAISTSDFAKGGGIYSKSVSVLGATFAVSGSTVSGNTASGMTFSSGGGFYGKSDITLDRSTVSGNSAGTGAAFSSSNAEIYASTISGNNSGHYGAVSASHLALISSTVASNTTSDAGFCAGVYVGVSAEIQNSIIANNRAANGQAAFDLQRGVFANTFDFTQDIVVNANFALPAPVIRDDPKLGPLAHNGGRTMTHALLPGSPAINRGSDPQNHEWDQRGKPYSRNDGIATDIGAFETSDRLFYDGVDY